MKTIERLLLFVHVHIGLPGFGHHHHHRFLQGTAGHQQKLEHIVKGAGIGTVFLDDREQLLYIVAEQIGFNHALARCHPVLVTQQGVDLAVVAHEAVGLGTIPGRECVGAETRVHHGQVRGEILCMQIRIKGHYLMRGQHALVDDHLGGQRADVEHLALLEFLIAA